MIEVSVIELNAKVQRILDLEAENVGLRAGGLDTLAQRYNTVVAVYHDAYAQWEVRLDAQRVVPEDCRWDFWAATLGEAVAKALAFGDRLPS